jgi:uncharacterized membrane protein YgaE (UPF0421/DUF939 family)
MIFASDANDTKKKILEKQIQKELENEQKYANEQTFYTEENYDFKGSEVNEESLKHLKAIEVEEFDMDHVYD